MATKNWKKVGKNEWHRTGNTGLIRTIFNKNVVNPEKPWHIRLPHSEYKHFKTKSEALSFAKRYMRKNK